MSDSELRSESRIDQTYLTMICDAFVEMEDMISDGEVGALLVGSGVEDVYSHSGRHHRLFHALEEQQGKDGGAGTIAIFLRRTGEHLKRRRGDEAVEDYRKKINAILSYAGLTLDQSLKLTDFDASKPIYSIPDAETRAQSLN